MDGKTLSGFKYGNRKLHIAAHPAVFYMHASIRTEPGLFCNGIRCYPYHQLLYDKVADVIDAPAVESHKQVVVIIIDCETAETVPDFIEQTEGIRILLVE